MDNKDETRNAQNPRPNPQVTPVQAANPNTQLYGEVPQNVHTQNIDKNDQKKKHWYQKIPKLLWLPLAPLILLLFIGALILDGGDFLLPKRWQASGIFGLMQLVGGALLLAVFINFFIFQSYQVVGDSMQPTLANGDRLIITKVGKSWSGLFGNEHIPKRGEIIIFDSPISNERQLVKRVIGVPGDRVDIRQGEITVFNDDNPEGFNPDKLITDSVTMDVNYTIMSNVGEGELFVAGDNRIGGASLDSRNDLGLVPIENVIGELILRLLPLSESKFF